MLRLVLISALVVAPICHYIFDSYTIYKHPPPPMGKYEEIAVWSDLYHRWVAVTPPDYAKVFLPTSGY